MSDLEKLLRSSLQQVGGEFHPSDPVAAREKFLRTRRRRRFYAVGEFALAAGIAVAAVLFVAQADVTGDDDLQFVASAPKVIAEIDSGSDAVAVAVGEGAVWVTNEDGNGVSQIDPVTNEKIGEVDIDGTADEVVTGFGAVWVSDTDGNIYRINPSTLEVLLKHTGEMFSFGGAEPADEGDVHLDLAVGPSGLWAVDPATGRISGINATPEPPPGVSRAVGGVTDLAAGAEGVWGYGPEGFLARLDAESGRFDGLPSGDGNSDLAIGFGAAWISSGGAGEIHRVDLSNGEVTNTADIGGDYADLTIDIDEEAVWALAMDRDRSTSTLYQLDPVSGKLLSRPLKLDGLAADISAGAGSLWIPDLDGKVFRVAPDVADSPSPEPTDAGPSEADLGDDDIVMVFERDGDIFVLNPDGEVNNLTDSPQTESDPSVSPDGRWIVYERRAERFAFPEIVTYDVTQGSECCVRPGSQPAIGPYEQLAWVMPAPTDATGGAQEIGFSMLGSEDEALSFPAVAADVAIPGFAITDLAWDQTGQTIAFEGGYENLNNVFVADVITNSDQVVTDMVPAENVLAKDREDGGVYLAPSSSYEYSVIHGCCVVGDGGLPTEFTFGQLAYEGDALGTYEFEETLALNELDGFDATGDLWTALMGEVWIEQTDVGGFSFVHRDTNAFAVGDGTHVWLVDDNGKSIEVPLDGVAEGAAPNPFHAFQNNPSDEG